MTVVENLPKLSTPGGCYLHIPENPVNSKDATPSPAGLVLRPGVKLMYPAAFSVFLGALAIGTVIGYPSMAITSMADSNSVVSEAMRDSENIAWFNSLMALAALPGAFMAGPLASSIGRRVTLITACIPFSIGWLIIAFGRSTLELFVGRIVTGLCTGMICVAGPVYIVEISSKEKRGLLGGLFGGIISGGILFCGIFGGFFFEWRGLAVLNACLPASMGLLLLFMPRSPKLLVSKGRVDKAMEAMSALHGDKIDVHLEILIMKGTQEEHHPHLSTRDLFSKSTLKAAGIASSLMLFQQFSGMNAVMMYAVPILQDAAPSVNPIYCTIMLQGIQVALNMIASKITNSLGRRVPLMMSAFLMGISLAGFGFCQYKETSLSWLPVLCCVGAVVGFAIGFGPLPWLVVAEIAPTKVSGLISSLATSTNWASFFLLIRTYDSLVQAMSSHAVFWMYSGWCALALVFTTFCLPETAHKSHHEIEAILEGRSDENRSEESSTESPQILVKDMDEAPVF